LFVGWVEGAVEVTHEEPMGVDDLEVSLEPAWRKA